MKTIEEILEQFQIMYDKSAHECYEREDVKAAMSEYAKQKAMAYFDWGVEQILPGSIPKEHSEDTMKARENLYKKFIESQNK